MSSAIASFFFLFLLCTIITVAQQQSFSLTIRTSSGSEYVTADFNLFSIRSPNFGVLVQNDAGDLASYSASPPPRTYLGTVRGRPGAMAAALAKPNGSFWCRISFENGIEWSSTGGEASKRGNTNWKAKWPTSVVPVTTGSSVIYVAEVGVDASYKEYVAAAANVNDTIDVVEFSILAANMPFLRDASILHKLGKLVIRASQSNDPYESSTKTGVLLNAVRSQWNGVIASKVGRTHNLALVVRPGAGGGLAYVSTVNTRNAYSSNGADKNGDFSVVWRHEAGHNWGSSHFEGGAPEGRTIMSGNALSRFSSSELAKILSYKARVPKLAVANLSISRPPRANMDTVIIQNMGPLLLSTLLDNDMDADFQRLSILSVQNTSALNGIAQVSSANQIVYTPSPEAALSVDYFSYRIQNVLGRTSTGYVVTRPSSVVAWWKMDQKNLLTVKDFSGKGIDGTITGSASWDQSLVFGGSSKVSFGTGPSLNGTTSFTLSVWVKVVSSSTMVIIQQRSQATSTTDGYNGEYRLRLVSGKPNFMVFGDNGGQFDFIASTAVNDGQWHHLVAVRDYGEGHIYVDGKLSASASGQVKNLDGNIPVFMGWDARGNTSFLTGSLRDARIYNRALSSGEFNYLKASPEALVDEGIFLKDQ